MTILAIIGKRFGDAGLHDLLLESGVLASGSINGVLVGKHFNRGLCVHKLVMEAMERLRLQQFGEWCAANNVDVDFEGIGTHVLELRSNCTKQNLETLMSSKAYQQLFDLYNDYCANQNALLLSKAYQQQFDLYNDYCANQDDPMFQFWSSYIDLVLLLMRFMRATKGHKSGRQLHLACVRDMLPWVFAYDRVNYSRYVIVYWCEMSCPSTTHPAANQALHEGEFAVQRCQNTRFGQVAMDQTTEQTVN